MARMLVSGKHLGIGGWVSVTTGEEEVLTTVSQGNKKIGLLMSAWSNEMAENKYKRQVLANLLIAVAMYIRHEICCMHQNPTL